MPLLIPCSLLGIVLLTGASESSHNFVYPIPVYEKITVDVYGALFPAALSVSLLILYFAHFKGSFLRSLWCFMFAFILSAISFKFALSDGGLELQSFPGVLGFLVGLVSVFIIFFDEHALKTKTLTSLTSSQMGRKCALAFLVTFSVSSLSALIVDLSFAPFLNQEPSLTSVNIGGGGLTDGILFFGLFAIVWTTFFVSVLALFVEIVRWSQKKTPT
jgi:hypothetical protein